MNSPCSPPRIARRNFLRACAVISVDLATDFRGTLAAKGVPARQRRGELTTGLVIGASRVCAAVTEQRPDGTVKLVGISHVPLSGVDGESPSGFNAVRSCVREALINAELQYDLMIGSVVLAVAGTKLAPCRTKIPPCSSGPKTRSSEGPQLDSATDPLGARQ